MISESVLEYIRSYFSDKAASDHLADTFRKLEIDSLGFVEFVMAVEEKYKIEIDTAGMDQDMTLAQFAAHVEKTILSQSHQRSGTAVP